MVIYIINRLQWSRESDRFGKVNGWTLFKYVIESIRQAKLLMWKWMLWVTCFVLWWYLVAMNIAWYIQGMVHPITISISNCNIKKLALDTAVQATLKTHYKVGVALWSSTTLKLVWFYSIIQKCCQTFKHLLLVLNKYCTEWLNWLENSRKEPNCSAFST